MREYAERLDNLPRRAAQRYGERTAVRTDRDPGLSFAELDARADAVAVHLRGLLSGAGRAVAVATVLDPAYAVAYYGVVRAGSPVVPLIPLLREDALAYQIAASEAEVLIASPQVADRIRGVRDRVPRLREILTFADLASLPAATAPDSGNGPDTLACIQFTSGTTGRPKAVRQTHRNLCANAYQTVVAHQLDADSVTLNHLPTYHTMHLNSAVAAAATQVLCTDPDEAASVAVANEVRATRYYGLPVRLNRLAADPRLAQLRFETVRAVSSGGSALPEPTARTLSEHFGIPVMQGFGLAETAPMTHCDLPHRPKIGSCGPPVEGAECRIVDLETREPVAAGAKGEIQVRGPQLMPGYLGERDGAALEDGWFPTGDVGYVDDDRYLFVVDRLKDVFKCDNWLVSPNEIEQVLRAHPAVRDCAVIDYPEPFSGAVAVALVVPADGAGPERVAAIAADVNAGLPYYQQVRHVEPVREVPRSPSGKIRRSELREQWHGRLTVTAPDRHELSAQM